MKTSNTEILKCFKILELDANASPDDVQKAFRKIVKIWHPDLYTGSPKLKDMAEEKLKAVNIAYATVRSYIATRQKIRPKTETQSSSASKVRKKYKEKKSAHGNVVSGLFSDPFSWLRVRNWKGILAEYIKSLRIENQPLNSTQYQMNSRPKVNRGSYGKNFKQIFEEVTLNAQKAHSSP